MAGDSLRPRTTRRRKVNQPLSVTCVKCGANMMPASAEPKSTYGRDFERKAFQCAKCNHVQIYTMGTGAGATQPDL